MGRWILRLVILSALGAAGYWGWRTFAAKKTQEGVAPFRTAAVTKGDLLVAISATGTVEPEKVIDVGAQVAGQILSFGEDLAGKPVDYGSLVDEGTVLARIDDAVYQADAALVEAQIQAAQAGIQRAEAEVAQAKARQEQAARDWKRAQDLGPSDALAASVYEGYQSAFETTHAAVAVAEAAVAQARASLAQAEAQQRKSKRNLSYCVITSPVKGVIIDRRVNIGQTVVASLNAPSLFLLAKDLTRMQVWAQVNEADIGKIRPGQNVTLNVDAFPGETFVGRVEKVRLNASMSQNVVTYTVEVALDNTDGKLLPYLTASLQFEINRKPGVLLVPSAALRWTPDEARVAPAHRAAVAAPATAAGPGGPPKGGGGRPGRGGAERTLWVKDGEFVRPMKVQAGDTDGVQTEITGEGVVEGLEIVTGLRPAVTGAAAPSANPFAPSPMGGSGSRTRPAGH